jgi:hypothetical protein
MRHDLLSCAMAGSSRRMVQAPAAAQLIAPAGRLLGLHARLLCTAAGAITLATVAAATDINLSPAARAQEKPQLRDLRSRRFRMWTCVATSGIMPRHACSARCRGTAPMRDLAVAGRRCACLNQPNRSSPQQCALATPKSRATREGLWICGQRKSVAHIPTGPTEAAARFNFGNEEAGPHRPD